MGIGTRAIVLSLVCTALAACDTAAPTDAVTPGPNPTVFSNDTYAAALESASLKLRGAAADSADFHRVIQEGKPAYEQIVDGYLDPARNPSLAPSLKSFYRSLFAVTPPPGTPDGLDYDDPANLATFIAVNGLPVRGLLLANYCVADDLSLYPSSVGPMGCSSAGAPSAARAGVITQRAFMKKFGQSQTLNLRRVSVVQQIFACSSFPDLTESPAPLKLTNDPGPWPMNPGLDGIMGTPDDFSDSSLGSPSVDPSSPLRVAKKYQTRDLSTGNYCVGCHSSLNARRTVFTAYDETGRYDATRTIDSVERTSFNGGKSYCSQMDPSSPECSSATAGIGLYRGDVVTTPHELGLAMVDQQPFQDCMTTRHVDFALGAAQGAIDDATVTDGTHLDAIGGTGPAPLAPAVLQKYRTVYEQSGWNTLELLRAVFEGPEFVGAYQ